MRIGLCLCLMLASACTQPKPETYSETTETPSPSTTSSTDSYIEDASVDVIVEDKLDESKILGSYETEYSLLKQNRAHNIHIAAERLNVDLPPRTEISFNQLVGPRTEENGFKLAGVIFDGEMITGIGGGVCQVSSTVHAAALMAGLKIIERRPHSRLSSYIKPGLDSTVNFPGECLQDGGICYKSDLIIRNVHSFTIGLRLSSTISKKNRAILKAEFVGAETGINLKYRWYSHKGEKFKRKLRQIKWRPKGYKKVKQKGQDGVIVFSILTGKSEERWKSEYQPVDEIWEVGSDWDMKGPPPWEPKDSGDPYE